MAAGADAQMQQQIMGKMDTILHHFSREMHATSDVFHTHKADPPPSLLTRRTKAISGGYKLAKSHPQLPKNIYSCKKTSSAS